MRRAVTVERKNRWSWVVVCVGGAAVLFALYAFPPEHSRFYPRCVFNALTGWQCPGCGGLRAAHQLLHGNIAASWQLNPLIVLGVAGGALWLSARAIHRWSRRDLLRPVRRPWLFWAGLGGLVIFGIARNLLHGG